MPIYPYQYLDANGEPTGEIFEVAHSIHAPLLTEHEGRPCARAFPPSAVPGIGGGARTWTKDEGTSLAHRYEVSEELFQNVPSLKGSITADGVPISRNDSHDRSWKKEMAAWSERVHAPQREARKNKQERARKEVREKVRGIVRERLGHYRNKRSA